MKPTLPNFFSALVSKMSSFKNLSALLVMLLFSGVALGQSTANYTFTTNTSGSLAADANSNAIDMTTGTTLLVNPGLDATASIVNTIGFDFYLNGSSFSRFSVNEDGILQLGSTVITTNLYTISAGSLTSPRLAAFNTDLRTGTSGKIHYKLIGTAPNRCLVVEFNNMQLFYTTATSAGTSTWQMRLYENGVIEYVYGAMNVSDITSTNKSPSIGFYLGSTAFASVNYSTNTSTTTGTYAANVAVAATGNITNLHSTTDGSRRKYLYTPTSANAPTALTFSNISSGAMQLNWTDTSADELGFIIERSTDNSTFTTLATLAANTVTYNAIYLAANTTYYFKVSPLREAKGTALSGNQATSAAPTYASVISIDGNTAVPGTSYPTITAAVADLGGTIASAITIQLTSTYNAALETYPIQLPYVAGSSATNTITIVQASGVSGKIIDSSNASSTFIIDGGNYWIIDGRSGGTGSTKDLVISNSSVTATAIQLINDASYNTLKYCTFKGVNTSAASGVVVIGSTITTAATGNDYNTITYCDVRDGATTPTNGIYSKNNNGTNNNNLISYNNVYNFFRDATNIDSYGIYITTGNNDITIDNNSLYQTVTRTLSCACIASGTAAGSIPIATTSASGYNFTITNNYIGGSAPLAAGTAWTVTSTNATLSYYVFQGIRMLTSLTGATSTIQGNTIKNINITTTNAASNQGGIIATGGNVNINNNTIGDPDASGSSPSIVFNNGGTGGEFNGIRTGTSSGVNGALSITNNTIAGIIINPVNAVGSVDFVGIRFGTTTGGTSNIASTNTIGSLTVANSIVNSTAREMTGIYFQSISPINTASNNIISNLSSTYSSSALTNRIYGIYTTNASGLAGGTNSIIGNTIKNLTTTCLLARSGASSMNLGNISIYGIYANSTTTNSLISSNVIFGLKNTSTTTASHILGIYAIAPATTYTNIIEKNSIYNLGFSGSSTSAITTVQGILTPSTATICTIKNNTIRLGYDASGTQLNNGMYIYGIYDQTTTTGSMNIWHNTVYIGGNAVASTAYPTYCFVSTATTPTRLFQNNIFINARSNAAGTGKHYAVWYAGTSTNPTGLTSNYNLFRATGTGGNIGYYNVGDRTDLTAWRTFTGQDANSISTDPCLNDPTAATPNLHLTTCSGVGSPAEGTGTLIASVSDDFDGETRSSLSPTDMGADAGNYGNTGSDMKATALVSPTTTGCKTATETVSVSVTNMSSVAIDFSVNNVTVTVTGPGGYSSSKVVNTGTLGAGLSQTVTMPTTIDLTANGTYTFNASTSVTGDINTANDAMAASSVIIFGGTYTVGTGGNYATIAAAVTAYNAAACFSSNVVFSLTDASYDTGTTALTINQNANSGAYTLTIKPAVGVSPTITGAVASSAIFNIRANNVIIDGSNSVGGTSRDLTITNTSITSPNVVVIGSTGTTPITSVTLKNTTVINGVNTNTAIYISNTALAAGYFNNITIQNNSIQKAYAGIYTIATVAAGNGSGLLITGNNIDTAGANSIRLYGIYVQGVDGATVSNNIIANIVNANAESPIGIWLATGTINATVSANSISNCSLSNTGAFGISGIYISNASTTTTVSLNNNTVSNFSNTGSGTFGGIVTFSPTNITNNTVTGLSGAYSLGSSYGIISSGNTNATISGNTISNISGTSAGSKYVYGMNIQGATSGLSIFKNTISAIKNNHTSQWYSYGLYLSSSATTAANKVYNNFIYDIESYGYIAFGMYLASGNGYDIDYNNINMNTSTSTMIGIPYGMYISSSITTAGSVNLRNNIIAITSTAYTSQYPVYCLAANTIFGTMNYNDYYSTNTNLGYIASTARTTLADFQTGFGGNANSISALPNFTSSTDLHLTAAGNCSINNAGTPISGITTDYDGATRSTSTPDIGADEFTGDINTAGAASSTPTLCNNTILTNITHATTVATGIGTATGLPTGVTAAWASNTITISGTPSATGTFNYTIPLSGGTCSVNATGTITVNPKPTTLVLTGSLACAGTTGSITSSTSVSGVDYQLYDSANAAVGSVQAGTGSGLTWSSIAIGTGYYAKATNSTTSCVSSNSNNVAVGTITDKTWIGGTSTSWNTASNWSCGTLPSASDVIIISSGSPVLDTNFTVGSGGSLTISGTSTTFTISPTSTLTVTGTANFGGKAVTIKSNSSGNGAIGQVTGTLSGATNVTVERYIPAKRSWRAITAPVTMTTSINANWQEGSPGTGNGYGFDIWSNSGGTGIITGGTGSSLLAYDSTTNNTWSAITNTTTASSMMDGSKNKPFMAFVTGPYGTNNVTAGATETTLRATGTLLTGDKTYPTVANKYTFIGNPYASPLDLTAVLNNTSNATASFGGNVWVWDANVLGTYSVGTYNLFDFAASNYSYTSSNANISGAQIQSGQAFFVKSTDGANFSIKEAHKGSVFTNAVFRSGAPEIMRVNLYKQVNNEWPGRDGAMTVILADANANQTPNKMANGTENIAFSKNGANFASNHHLPLVATDVLNVKVWNTTASANYKLKINTEQFATTNLDATLEDLFTNSRTPLSLDGSAVEYPFTVTTDALSTGDRFRIVFQTSTLGTTIPTATSFSIIPNPVTGDSFQVNLGSLATGTYSYSICNAIGQEVEKGSINTTTQNTNYTVKFRETAATGIYIMKIKGSDNSVFTAKLIKK